MILGLWLILSFLVFGVPALIFFLMRRVALNSWNIRMDRGLKPKVSVIIPTLNESNIIHFKLENLSKVDYPNEMMEIIVVDSDSSDTTIDIVQEYASKHTDLNIRVLVEKEHKGKSAALNYALLHCTGDVIIVSDADCFWPPDILYKALPFLDDPDVGAVSGLKILLNPNQSWVTKAEKDYLDSMNRFKVGESKAGSTLFFEGGFSAYKKEVLSSFDPYATGSDDCGTIISLIERKLRAVAVPEAQFYTTFPLTWKGRVSMKIRRSSQLVRVFMKYISLLLSRRVTSPKLVILQRIFTHIFNPIMFVAFVPTTILLLFNYPIFSLIFLALLVPGVRSQLFELIQNYLVLFLSIFSVLLNRRFAIWDKPEDRALIKEGLLRQHGLI